MPCFRGIELTIVTDSEADAGRLPEFPHPDGSSVRLLGPNEVPPSPQGSIASTRSDRNITHLPKANPVISVYVPSLPGFQFWIQYSVLRPPESTTHLFFKLFINGRNITSWGVKAQKHLTGSIVRALYEPSDRWHFRENGVLLKRDGIESRYFHFGHGPETQSVADDGGLIEVQVFRALGRRGRAARLEQYRSQEKYGISSPSGGLLENPEEAEYYDWLLRDPKTSPYASFRFHYRSWINLRNLNLVPKSEGDAGISDISALPPEPGDHSQDAVPFAFDVDPAPLVDENDLPEMDCPQEHSSRDKAHTLQRTPKKFIRRCSGRDPYKSYHSPSMFSDLSTVSRKASCESHTPSITPSLLQYVEGDSFNEEEIEYGIATSVALSHDQSHRTHGQTRPLPQPPQRESSSEYGSSSPSSEGSTSPVRTHSANAYLPTTGSSLERQLSFYASIVDLPQDDGATNDFALSDLCPLKVSESEWMTRPSPKVK